MRDVLKTEELDIPEGVTVEIKARVIKVTGPRGSLTKIIRHVDMDIRVVKAGKNKSKVILAVWQGGRKHVACLNTIRSLINNMIIGVTKVYYIHLCTEYNADAATRASSTKCVQSMLTFPSTPSYKITGESWKL